MLSSRSIGPRGRLRLRPDRAWSLSDVWDHVAVPGAAEARTPSASRVVADTLIRDDGLSHPETSAIITLPHASYNFRSLLPLLELRVE